MSHSDDYEIYPTSLCYAGWWGPILLVNERGVASSCSCSTNQLYSMSREIILITVNSREKNDTQTFPSHTAADTNVGTVPVMFKILMLVSTSPHLQTMPTHSSCHMKCLYQDRSTATFQGTLIESNTTLLHLCVSVAT